jgi:hypothetical protein
MDQNTLLRIQNLKRKALERCEDRIQKAREGERGLFSSVDPGRRQHGMTSILKQRHGL